MLKRIDTIISLLETAVQLLEQPRGTLPAPEPSDTDMPQGLTPWIGKKQVMDYLEITHSTYCRWVEEGFLQPRGPGVHRYYERDILELMEHRNLRKRR